MARTASPAVVEASNDRLAMIEDHLALGDRHIAEGEARISRREAAIAEQARTGRDTTKAIRLLQAMQDTLAFMHEHQELLLHLRKQTLSQQEQARQARVPPPTNLECCPP